LIRHSPDSRGFGARIVPLTGSGNDNWTSAYQALIAGTEAPE
jgi:hypothetical protein